MVKLKVLYLYHGVLLSNKKEVSIDICNNLSGSQEVYAESKKKGNLKMVYTVGFHLHNMFNTTKL